MGSSFNFVNADGTQDASIKCKFSCTPAGAGNYAGFLLHGPDPGQPSINSGPIAEGIEAIFNVPNATVQAGVGYTLYFSAAAAAAGTFTVNVGVFQGASALGGVFDPTTLTPGQAMPAIQLDATGFATADTGVSAATQTFYGVAITAK